eukprot:TRINITY_DN10773_c0_g1_i1.p1 TRINITY_DN10773_c0_g1~~TRINITY_DN10773_c0_g1_i1.p1  ORF type:complete len:689 (+),score=100.87 TRINITY_DN10773_c0_g1_i1:163-2067(+)
MASSADELFGTGSDSSADVKEDDLGKDPRRRWLAEITGGQFCLEVLCGITVALALVPEAVAFALSAGLTPSIGLHSAWIISVFTAVLGGRPAMICGAAGSIAVLIGDIVRDKGVEYLFYAVILMGIVQIVLGLVRVGALVKLIPLPVMIGFCNGLALVTGLAQFDNFKVPHHKRDGVARRLGSFHAFTEDTPWLSGREAIFAGLITAISFFVCLLLPKLTKRIPSALVAIVSSTVVEWAIVRAAVGSHTTLVGDIAALGGSFPKPVWLDSNLKMPPLSWDTFHTISNLSVTMAAVGLLESLMTLNLIDDITQTRGSTLRECIGQGIANIVCGALGGMGGCAMIGQSMINVTSGGRKRLSSVTAGLGLLFIVLVAYPAINIIPVSGLVGVMFNVVYATFEFRSLKLMLVAAMPQSWRNRIFSKRVANQKIRRSDAFVILVVTLVTPFTNLAIAVAAGMAFSFFFFVLESAELIHANAREVFDDVTGRAVKFYDIHGVLFFGSTARFLELFDVENDPEDVRLAFESGFIVDYSAIEALNKLGERYGALGKKITLQDMKDDSSQVVKMSAGLLKKEICLKADDAETLPIVREHMHVETTNPLAIDLSPLANPVHRASFSRSVSRGSSSSTDDRMNTV